MDLEHGMPHNLDNRVAGIILGAAVGDALGWPQEQRSGIQGGNAARSVAARPEFRGWSRHSGNRFARYEEKVAAGEYSDDTQLLLAVARSCITSDWRHHFSRVELPIWPIYQRGGGLAVLRASRVWATSERPPWSPSRPGKVAEDSLRKYFSGGANGVAMRIAPHAAVTVADESPGSLIERVLNDGICTHGHPRALIGGLVHALALRYVLRLRGPMDYEALPAFLRSDKSWQSIDLLDALPIEWLNNYKTFFGESASVLWASVIDETKALLDTVLHSLGRGAIADDESTLAKLGCFDKKVNGAGHITAAAAVYVTARMAARPISGLLYTAYLLRADTDTLASMTASLLGAVHGTDWLEPMSIHVQDAAYLTDIAQKLSDAARTRTPEMLINYETSPVSRENIGTFLVSLDNQAVGSRGKFPDQRRYVVVDKEELYSSSGTHKVWRSHLKFIDGQTMVVDRPYRSSSGSGDSATHRRNFSPGSDSSGAPRPYDTSHSKGPGDAHAELQLAKREIELRQRFHDLFVIASTDPQAAVVSCRKEIEVLLAELSGRGLRSPGDFQVGLFPSIQLDLGRTRLTPSTIEMARELWRRGSAGVHGERFSAEQAIKYVASAEGFAVRAIRESWLPIGD
jgi:ADP-ribosylglycohydrolase